MVEIKYGIFLDDKVKLPSWFNCSAIAVNKDTPGMVLDSKWIVPNEKALYAFKIPTTNPKGRFIGENKEYRFYLRYILISRYIPDENTFLMLMDVDLELQPNAQKLVEISRSKGTNIPYLKHIQPAYNILCPVPMEN